MAFFGHGSIKHLSEISNMTHKIAVLPGDGIGPEIVAEAVKVLECLRQHHGLRVELEYGRVGGEAYDHDGHPLPE